MGLGADLLVEKVNLADVHLYLSALLTHVEGWLDFAHAAYCRDFRGAQSRAALTACRSAGSTSSTYQGFRRIQPVLRQLG